MTTVYFVRHAEPDLENHDDATRGLSAKGLKDRELVTAFFRDKEINAVFSSPFERAVSTIRPLAEAKNLSIQTIHDFRERCVEAGWIEDFQDFCRKQWTDFSYRRGGGECLREVQQRNVAALETLLTKYEGRTFVVGSHGTALSTIINHYDNSFGYEDFERIKGLMPWLVRFDFEGKKCISICQFNPFEETEA